MYYIVLVTNGFKGNNMGFIYADFMENVLFLLYETYFYICDTAAIYVL